MTMKEKEAKLTKQPSKAKLTKTSKFAFDAKLKAQIKSKASSAKSVVAKRHEAEGATEPSEGEQKETKKEVKFASEVEKREIPARNTEETEAEEESESLAQPDDNNDSVDGNDEEKKENEEGEDTNDENKEQKDGSETTEGSDETKTGEEEANKTDGEAGKGEENKDEKGEDKKGGKKGKGKKGKGKKDTKKEERRRKERAKKQVVMDTAGEVTANIDDFRAFLFDKVQTSLSMVYSEGITEVNCDTIMPLLNSLEIDTTDESIHDLIKDALIDNFGVIDPLTMDQVVQKSQDAKAETEMDDCLEVAFRLIDFDEDGFITQKDIYKLMEALGEELGEYALDDMVAAVDMDNDGKISLRDFRFFLLGRDVPSRKEILAQAEAKRKAEEEKKRLEDEEKARQESEILAAKEAELKAAYAKEEAEREALEEAQESAGTPSIPPSSTGTPTPGNQTPNDGVGEGAHSKDIDDDGSPVVGSDSGVSSEPSISTEDNHLQTKDTDTSVRGSSPSNGNINASRSESRSGHVEANDQNVKKTFGRGPSLVFESFDNDEDEDISDSEHGPVPLSPHATAVNIPTPDLSTVVPGSPCFSPIMTPRKRPSIVKLSGLAVSDSDNRQNLEEAIEILHQDLIKDDSHHHHHHHHKRRGSNSKRSGSVAETQSMSSTADIEDFNNRLVFKLPARRKSSITSPVPAKLLNSIVLDTSSDAASKQIESRPPKDIQSNDTDEGIDLEIVEEELVERSVCVPSDSQPSATSLRISLPSGDDSPEDWEKAEPEVKINLEGVVSDDDDEKDNNDDNINEDECETARGKHTLGVAAFSDTPRSLSRSEVSQSHLSFTSPRSDFNLSEDEVDLDEEDYHRYVHKEEISSRSAKSVVSFKSDQYDCDADSVHLSIKGSDFNTDVEDNFGSTARLSDFPDTSSEGKSPKTTKSKKNGAPVPVQKIELRELDLKSPVKAGQLSNRQRFGMIPRDLSKFLVLGKNISDETNKVDKISSARTPRVKSARQSRSNSELDLLTPRLRWQSSARPMTARSFRERDVLHSRRISLMENEVSSVFDLKRDFDVFSADPIVVPTMDANAKHDPQASLKCRAKQMERRILRRAQTQQDLLPVLKEVNRDGFDTTRSETIDLRKKRSYSASSHRSSVSLTESVKRPFQKQVTVVDLTKTLRRDSVVKNIGSRKHKGVSSIVPLARVVMAYNSIKKKQHKKTEFYSISRQLERKGIPYQGESTSPRNAYSVDVGTKEKKKKKHSKRKSFSAGTVANYGNKRFSEREEREHFCFPLEENVSTLVGDMKDPDMIPNEVVYEKVRHLAFSRPDLPLAGHRGGANVTQSSVVTLELPEHSKYEPKLKSTSMLSKLPMKTLN